MLEIGQGRYNTPANVYPPSEPKVGNSKNSEPVDKVALQSESIRKFMDALDERAENHTLSQFTLFKSKLGANSFSGSDFRNRLKSSTTLSKFIDISLSGTLSGGALGGAIGGAAGLCVSHNDLNN